MGYMSRLPNSNEPPRKQDNPWIEEDDFFDAVALVLNGFAKRCQICKRPIRLKYLDENGHCPDCRT